MKHHYLWLALATTTAVLAESALHLSPSAAPAQGPTGTARIVATVVLMGTPPAATRLPMNADPYCAKANLGQTALSQTVEVGANGALKNAIVFVKDGISGTYPAPTTPVTLDQKQCVYVPHVLGVLVGQPVQIVNSDATLHNIHPQPVANTGFNIGMPVQGMKQTKVFTKAETPFPVKCDVHSWMSSYIGVFSNPFFGVSNDQGMVELRDLPAGTFQVQAWQEKYGMRSASVTVGAGETKQVTFTYKVP